MLLEQLRQFEKDKIFYVIWKNLYNYSNNLNNPLDLDIYISPKDTSKAIKILFDKSIFFKNLNKKNENIN